MSKTYEIKKRDMYITDDELNIEFDSDHHGSIYISAKTSDVQALIDNRLKDYCNALFVAVREFLPLFPFHFRERWKKLLDDGKALRAECYKKIADNVRFEFENSKGDKSVDAIATFIEKMAETE